MNNQTLKDQGVACIHKAVELDGSDHHGAFKNYVNGVGQLLIAIKYEKNALSKNIMLDKVSGYIARAEMIKKQIHDEDTASQQKKTQTTKAPLSENVPSDENMALRSGIMSTMINAKDINVSWSDVAGLECAKGTIKEAVILPLKFPNLYTGKRKPWKGILLYGPPGTGKSFLAKAVASESKSSFFSVSSSDLISKWQGESERAVKVLFQLAREHSPSVIFIDEIDSLAGERTGGEQDSMRRVKTEFLVQMQGVNESSDETKKVLVLGATNTPWTLDPAFRRRFEKRIYVPLPNDKARIIMFKLFLKDTDNDIDEIQFNKLGKITDGYSGSDISVVLRDALMAPIRKCQHAKQFITDNDGLWHPVIDYPSCNRCPMDLSTSPSNGKKCEACGAHCITLDEIPDPELLNVPIITITDVIDAIHNNSPTVSSRELNKYVEWTKTFGQDG
jgi:vacuolar protein-sorting-associated protein 4